MNTRHARRRPQIDLFTSRIGRIVVLATVLSLAIGSAAGAAALSGIQTGFSAQAPVQATAKPMLKPSGGAKTANPVTPTAAPVQPAVEPPPVAPAEPVAPVEPIAPSAATTSVSAGLLQGQGQEQLLCKGGALQGKLSEVVIQSGTAATVPAGGCNLADIRAANPGMRILAYMNVAVMAPPTGQTGALAAFQPSCITAPSGSPNGYAVPIGTNTKLAGVVGQSAGNVVRYPDYSWLVMANLSDSAYRKACAAGASKLLSTPSAPGVRTGAPATKFDGIMLDDANMSPQHGLNVATVGAYGPWTTDAQYGDDMNATIGYVTRTVKASAGRTVTFAANLGVTPWDKASSKGRAVNPESGSTSSTELQRALTLAGLRIDPKTTTANSQTPALDQIVREYGVQWANGAGLSTEGLSSARSFHEGAAKRNVTVIIHDYSVGLREGGTAQYAKGQAITGTTCLKATSKDVTATVSAAAKRRTSDQALTNAFALMSRTSGAKSVIPTVNQSAPSCQGAGFAEKLTTPSVDLSNSLVAALASKLARGVYRSTDVTLVPGTHVNVFKVNDGTTVYINPDATSATATVSGKSMTFPPRSVMMR